jgi:hypothetical protein
MRTSCKRFSAALGLAVAIVAATVLAFAGEGRAQPQAPTPTEFRARILEIYGDKAIVEIDGRRVLVEALQSDKPFPGEVGAEIQIVGYSRDNVLVPSQITLPSGVSIQRQALETGPGRPGFGRERIEGQLRELGITAVGRPFRRRHQTVVEGRADDGRRVIASFDRGLRLEEIEETEFRHIHPMSPDALPPMEVAQRLANQGYSSVRLIDQGRFRLLYSVNDRQGQPMELLVDRSGVILRRVWLR